MREILTNLQIDGETTHSVLDSEQTAIMLPVEREALVPVKLHGLDSAATGDITFKAIFHNGRDWDTEEDLSFAVTMNGTNDVVKGIQALIGDARGIKLLSIQNGNSNVAVTGEGIGTGDGATTSFSGTLARKPVKPSSVTIHYTIGGTDYTATDDGSGNISGTDVSGTIDYQTGDWSLTFTTAPDDATNITADYTVNVVVVVDYVGVETK